MSLTTSPFLDCCLIFPLSALFSPSAVFNCLCHQLCLSACLIGVLPASLLPFYLSSSSALLFSFSLRSLISSSSCWWLSPATMVFFTNLPFVHHLQVIPAGHFDFRKGLMVVMSLTPLLQLLRRVPWLVRPYWSPQPCPCSPERPRPPPRRTSARSLSWAKLAGSVPRRSAVSSRSPGISSQLLCSQSRHLCQSTHISWQILTN